MRAWGVMILNGAQGLLRKARTVLSEWNRRRQYRGYLANMEARDLRDIGLSAHEAGREARRPMWMRPIRRDESSGA